jgi:GDP-4-dehydro-6-deoxy-D-mannose reductase
MVRAMPADQRILVTGANGFVGGWLQRELIGRDGKVEVIAATHGGGEGVEVDITQADAVVRLVADVKPTAVVHLAAISAPVDARSSPRAAWDVNVMGTLNLAQAVLAQAPDARFVHVSSSECYGASFAAGGKPIAEDARLDPTGVYGATKAAADLMVGQMARDGLQAIRFRPFNHTGPGQTDSFVVPAFARQVAAVMAGRREPVIEVGNLAALRDFLDVRDVVRAYADAALSERGFDAGSVFNLASGTPWRIGDILDRLIALSGMRIDVRTAADRLRRVEIPVMSGDAGAAFEALGWKPEISFETTLRDVLEDWRQKLAAGFAG